MPPNVMAGASNSKVCSNCGVLATQPGELGFWWCWHALPTHDHVGGLGFSKGLPLEAHAYVGPLVRLTVLLAK